MEEFTYLESAVTSKYHRKHLKDFFAVSVE